MSKTGTFFSNSFKFWVLAISLINFGVWPELFAPKKSSVLINKAQILRKKSQRKKIVAFFKKHWPKAALVGSAILGAGLVFYNQFYQNQTIPDPKIKMRPAAAGEIGIFDGQAPAVGGFLKGGLLSKLTTSQSPGAKLFKKMKSGLADDELIKIKPDDKGLLGTGNPTIETSTLRDIQKYSIVVVDGTLMSSENFKDNVGKLKEIDTEGTVCHGQYCFSFVEQAGISEDGKACYRLKNGPIDEDPTKTIAVNPFVMLSISGFSQTKTKDITLDRTQSLWRTTLAAAKAMNVTKISSPAIGMGVFDKGPEVTKLYFEGLCEELKKPEFECIKEFRIHPKNDSNDAILQKVLAKKENTCLKNKIISMRSDALLLAEKLAQQEAGELWALINPSNGNVTAGKKEIGNGFCGNIGPAEEFFTAMTTASICTFEFTPERWKKPMSVDQIIPKP